jgi:flagellin-like protein
MKKGVSSKRGLSPVVASALMIALVIVLALIIFLWARGFVSEQIEKFGMPVEKHCESLKFNVERIGDALEIRNDGDVDIFSFDIKLFKDGNSEIDRFDFSVDAGKSISRDVTLMMGENDDVDPDKVIIYPALIGSLRGENLNKPYTCLDNGVVI